MYWKLRHVSRKINARHITLQPVSEHVIVAVALSHPQFADGTAAGVSSLRHVICERHIRVGLSSSAATNLKGVSRLGNGIIVMKGYWASKAGPSAAEITAKSQAKATKKHNQKRHFG